MQHFSVVVAATQSGGIGNKGTLPWPRLTEDLKFFRELTTYNIGTRRNVVVMGRVTWDSLPASSRPLPGRINVVITKTREHSVEQVDNSDSPTIFVPGFSEAFTLLGSSPWSEVAGQIFVIGGAAIYEQAISSPFCTRIFLTRVMREYQSDRHLRSGILDDFEPEHFDEVVVSGDSAPFQLQLWRRKAVKMPVPHPNIEEQQYLDLVRRIIETGVQKGDRTGTGTLSVFGAQMRFSLRDGRFPCLTTKRVFWRGIVEELLWIIKGCTDSKKLAEKKVHIWDDNGGREFLDNLGFNEREVGDLGPVYGHQWRRFGSKYIDCHTDYTGQGIDQLAQVIHTIKTNPNDRRIIMSAWNPNDIPLMALPPCHMMCQFYVTDGELSCMMLQRSGDTGLGIPFNISSYSLLTCMIAHVCGLKPGEFIHIVGDAHVYLNHVDALKQQLERTPSAFPTLCIKRKVDNIDDFKFEDFQLDNYNPAGAIKMNMAV